MEEKRYYGKYRGFVYDNKDTRKEAKCRLIVPGVLGEVVTDWATPCNNLFFGMTIIPKNGDPVWAEFENGDVQKPLYTCAWYSSPTTSNVPNLAKGIGDETTNKGNDSFSTASGGSISEPGEPYGAIYPNNKVLKTFKKLTIELDDTDGKERIKIAHPSGTVVEIHPDGKMVTNVINDEYKKNSANKNNHVVANYNLGIGGNKDENIGSSCTTKIGTTDKLTVGDSQSIEIGTSQLLEIGTNQTINISANKDETIGANNTKNVQGLESETILLGKTSQITVQNDLTVLGTNNRSVLGLDSQTITGIKQLNISGPLTIAAASISLTTPSGTILMSGGVMEFTVPACNFNIEQCNFNTQNFGINSSGPIVRKSSSSIVDEAPTIDHI